MVLVIGGSARRHNPVVLDSNLPVPNSQRSLELVRTCHRELQYLITLRNEKLDLLRREPRVLERVNSIIETATQGLARACSLVEKCRPEAHCGKLPIQSRVAWRFRDAAAFREQEPIIHRNQASVASEIGFLRQLVLAKSATGRETSTERRSSPTQAAFENIALLDGLMGDVSGSITRRVRPTPTILTEPARLAPASQNRVGSSSNWPEAVTPGAPAVPASPIGPNARLAELPATNETTQMSIDGCTLQSNSTRSSLTNASLRRKPCPKLSLPDLPRMNGRENVVSRPMQMRQTAPLLRHMSSRQESSHGVFFRMCHSDSQLDLTSAAIREEDETIENVFTASSDWSPLSPDENDTVQARDLVSPLQCAASRPFPRAILSSSLPARNSTYAGRECARARVISRQYPLPVMTNDIFGSSLISSLPGEWIHRDRQEINEDAESESDEEIVTDNSDDGNSGDGLDSESIGDDESEYESARQTRQNSVSKKEDTRPKSASDTNLNTHVTARWAQEPIELFLPAQEGFSIARNPVENSLENHPQPPPPYQEALGTGEMDFSFLDALCQAPIPGARVETPRDDLFELE